MPGETPSERGETPTNTPNPNDQQPGAAPNPGETQGMKWEDWLNLQPETVRKLHAEHTSGLKTALTSERKSVEALSKQLKELQAKAEKGSELEGKLNEINGQLTEASTKAAFYEALPPGCTSPARVYLLAKTEGLIDERGRYDVDKIKAAFPEYFAKPVPTANAGSGAGGQPPALQGNAAINQAIRRAAGRQ